MSYTVLARKYRPQTFADLTGQEHIATTLSNAIASNRVAHAFLFTGARGVGKTTTARLLAKALNCEKGPTAQPCNECSACTEIAKSTDVDVLEMDGASNNSVEDVRRLQESIPFRPSRDRYKIIIIDEVHMLSSGAFNALLKTLEEPPDHVKFIFATTEAHKIPITIRSRCQKYDFRLIRRADIADRIRHILDAEGVGYDDEAIALCATEAAGSMRDALTLLDQLIAAHDKNLEGKKISEALGIASRQSTYLVIDALLKQSPQQILQQVDSVISSGVDPVHFLRQVIQVVRDLIVLRITKNAHDTQLTPDELELAEQTSATASELELQRQFTGLAKLLEELGRSSNPQMTLEMGLVRLASRPSLRSIEEILSQLERGEAPTATAPAKTAAPKFAAPAQPAAQKFSAPPPQKKIEAPVPAAAAPKPQTQSAPKGSVAQALTGAPASNPKADSGSEPSMRRAALMEWERMIKLMKESHPALSAVLEHGVPRRISQEKIVLSFEKNSFFAGQASSKSALDAIKQVATQLFGTTPEIEVRTDASAESVSGTLAAVESQQRQQETQRIRQQALDHPAVRSALEIFPEAIDKVEVQVGNVKGER